MFHPSNFELFHHGLRGVTCPQGLNNLEPGTPANHVQRFGGSSISDFQVNQINANALVKTLTAW